MNNNIAMAQTLTLLSLTSPLTSIVGRAVVLRAQQDNCTGVDGYAGDRLAQCVIGMLKEFMNWPLLYLLYRHCKSTRQSGRS